ncbi:HNH endonuclease [Microbacterium sp. JZ37]|uniref:HNH endonuclease n=1 Tax=Microbacterium sp. JZ37 TaxID=2654193 RepID=UPI002B45EB29|nr:DUF222 domain-containing protein [Microbacterium sp. JZ37]WRH16507.1 DUF222 domain-containing protein [Microbacterium sp. JZ37]
MSRMTSALSESLAALRADVADLDVDGLAPDELRALTDVLGALRRSVDASLAAASGEIARQSRRELGKDGFARRQGYSSPGTLLSATTGVTTGEAARLMRVGEAIAPRMSLVGERLPAKHPHVAEALRAGALGLAAAEAIVGMLDRVVVRAGTAACDEMESILVARAPGLTSDELRRLLLDAEMRLDPDGAEDREQDRRDRRMLAWRTERDGSVSFTGRADPETAAPIVALLDGMVTQRMRANEHEPDEARRDRRTRLQMQIDILADVARHALGCTAIPTRPIATMVVRMDYDTFRAALDEQNGDASGGGMATIDGIEQPVTAKAVRRMAVDAQIIPCVLGGKSEILDLGRRERLFTPKQKLAISLRDEGCAFCGAPPGHAVVHHIEWWSRGGRTDLDNGILLCVACHHRIHDDGWDIRIDGAGVDAVPWFIPPPWLDHTRTPRRGGPTRYRVAC